MPRPAVVAGVDTSTQSTTVEIREVATGRLLGSGSSPHPPTHPPVSEQPPEAWWEAFRLALATALAAARVSPQDVAALSVAGQCHGLVLVDDAARVVRPAKLWNDTTSAPQARAMVEDLGPDTWSATVGSIPTAAFTITKLAWVAEHDHESLDRAARIMLPHDYMTWRLTGRAVTDRSEASGTGYYAANEGRYRTDLLDRYVSTDVPWKDVLPDVLAPAEAAGHLRADVARELGLDARALVGAGAGDQHAGAVGLGAAPGDLVVSLGTSGVVFTTSDHPVNDPTGWVDGVADATGRYLPLVCTLNAAKVTDAAARWLGVHHEDLARLALAAPDAPDRPVMAAYLDGERSPDRPLARGALAGLTPDTTREQIALAAVEGVLLGLVEGVDALRRCGAETRGQVIVTGGAARSPAYRQVLADLLDREVQWRAADDASARGAAVQAAAVLQGATVDDVRDAWRPAAVSVDLPRGRDMSLIRERYRELAGWTGLDRVARDPTSVPEVPT